MNLNMDLNLKVNLNYKLYLKLNFNWGSAQYSTSEKLVTVAVDNVAVTPLVSYSQEPIKIPKSTYVYCLQKNSFIGIFKRFLQGPKLKSSLIFLC